MAFSYKSKTEQVQRRSHEDTQLTNARSIDSVEMYRQLGNAVMQKKLKVGQVGDASEQQADRVARQVVAAQSHANPPKGLSISGESNPQIQRKANNGHGQTTDATAIIDGGRSLSHAERHFFEPRFGRDFTGVRIHDDNRAHEAAQELNAKAFTVGRDIVFNRGQYALHTRQGKQLLAHELTHTLQQGDGPALRLAPDHTVKAKETLYSIATLYGLSVSDIQTANGLKRTSIKKGDVLKIPNPATYAVKAKETLYAIATRFGVSVADLKKVNGLTSDAINAGDVLKIPVVGTTKHTVTSGETLSAIARRYGVSVADIQKANGLSGTTIKVGDVLNIPAAAPLVKAPAKAPAKTPAKKPPSKAPTVVPAPAVSVAGTFPGHEPGKDYADGEVLERSFARKADLSTVITEGGKQVFFEKGAKVKRVSGKGMWLEVSSEAYTNTKSPAKVMSGKSPKIITGWIKREWTDMTLGRFSELDIDDRSHFKAKGGGIGHVGYGSELPKADVKNVVMHQTGSADAVGTINTYQSRVTAGSSVATHYLIGQDGKIYLTGSINRLIDHVGPPTSTVRSANAIGIEHSGVAHSITAPAAAPKDKNFAAEMAGVRKELKALTMSPEFKKTLLGKSDKDLYYALKWSGWNIYGDITAGQKRSSYLLTRSLRSEFGLGAGDLKAHEKVSKKTLGEGENITEFHEAMEAYPAKVKQLETLSSGIASLSAIVTHEKGVLNAVTVDATAAENAALAREKAAKKPAVASAREALRVAFYKDFYARIGQIDDMIAFLTAAAGKPDATRLAAKIKAWKK